MHRYLSLFKLQIILRNSMLALTGFCLFTGIAAQAQSAPVYTWIIASGPPAGTITAPDSPNWSICRGTDSAGHLWVGYWNAIRCVGSNNGVGVALNGLEFLTLTTGATQWTAGTGKTQPSDIGTVPSNTINAGNTYTNVPQVICSQGGFIGFVVSNQCSIGGATGLNAQKNATVLTGMARTPQSITFPAPGTSLGVPSPPITFTATASSGLPVSYSISGPGNLTGSTFTTTAPGTVIVTASQAGNASYGPAPNVQQTIIVNTFFQHLDFPAIAAPTGSAPVRVPLNATATSGLGVVYGVSGPAYLDGSTLIVTGPGQITVTASQPGNATYAAAESFQKTTISTVVQPTYAWVSAASPPFNVVTAPDAPNMAVCRGMSKYHGPSAPADQFAGYWDGANCRSSVSGNAVVDDNPQEFLTVTTPGPGPLWLSGTGKRQPINIGNTPSNAIGSGNTIDFKGGPPILCSTAGYVGWAFENDCEISAITLNGGQNTTFLAGVIGPPQSAQTINFAPLPFTNVTGPGSIPLFARATSGLPVTFTVSGPATLNGNLLSITGSGSVVLTASQAGNSSFFAAAPVQQTILSNFPLPIYEWMPANAPPPHVVTAPDAPNAAICRGNDSAGHLWVGSWNGSLCVGSDGGGESQNAPNNIQFLTTQTPTPAMWVQGTGKTTTGWPSQVGTLPANTISGGLTYSGQSQIICSLAGYPGWVDNNMCAVGPQASLQRITTILVGTLKGQ